MKVGVIGAGTMGSGEAFRRPGYHHVSAADLQESEGRKGGYTVQGAYH